MDIKFNPNDSIPLLLPPNELTLVDPDIRELSKGRTYYPGMLIQLQLIKELRLLREAIITREHPQQADAQSPPPA